MVPSSLIGFGLVLIAASMTSSIVLTGGTYLGRNRLRSLGPWAERRAATLGLMLPPLIGLGMTLVLGGNSASALFWGTDHCLDHPHHLHLCWVHGTHWIDSPLAVGSLGFFVTFALVRVVGILAMHVRTSSTVRELLKAGEPVDEMKRIFLIPVDERVAFTSGIFRPVILVSKVAWDALNAQERQAVITHEQTHIAHGDIWKRNALAILSTIGAPVLANRSLELFEQSSERLCDSNAAQCVRKPSIVAGAILALARPLAEHRVPAAVAHASGREITERIHALFGNGPSGKTNAKRLGLVAFAVAMGVVAVGILFAESLHHIFETILG